MAQIPYRANLQSMTFPLLFNLAGKTVIDQGADQTFYPQVSTDGQVPIDRGIPKALYAHNVIPSTYGWQSVGFEQIFNPHTVTGGPAIELQSAHFIQGAAIQGDDIVPQDNRTYLALGRAGSSGVFVLSPLDRTWKLVANGQPTVFSDSRITVANINGFSYIYISRVGCFIYNAVTDTLIPRTLEGLDTSQIIGITASNGYLIAYSNKAVSWSSVVDPEDFVPSDVSGAGGGNVQEAAGLIVVARPTFLGFIVYTRGNAISVTYSGNENFPWNFKSIPSSGGILSADTVAEKEVGGYQYYYSTNGLQRISHVKAETIFPEITDFMSSRIFEDFDEDSFTFNYTIISTSMRKKVAIISDRYMILSYGPFNNQPMKYALIVDLLQSRYGKVKLDHNHCFERQDISNNSTEAARESICFMQGDGTSFSLDNGVLSYKANSVIIFGKYQVTRERKVALQEVEIENVAMGFFDLYAFPSANGKTLGNPVSGYLLESESLEAKFLFDGVVGHNLCLMATGNFSLVTMVLWFTLHGRY